MKTKIILPAILAGTLLLSTCVGTKAMGVLDESVPEAMQCPLEIRNKLAVILFNNQPVMWAPSLTENKVTISLPPGSHSFTVRWLETRKLAGVTDVYPVTKDLSMEFIPGHSCRIYKQTINLIITKITNVKIKEVASKGKK